MPAEPVSKFCHQDLLYGNRLYRGENQPNTTDLYQKLNYRFTKPRISYRDTPQTGQQQQTGNREHSQESALNMGLKSPDLSNKNNFYSYLLKSINLNYGNFLLPVPRSLLPLNTCLKPVPNVAICGLVTLASSTVNEQALALAEAGAVWELKEVSDLASGDSHQEHAIQETTLKNVHSAIASPESIVVPEFTASTLSLPLFKTQEQGERILHFPEAPEFATNNTTQPTTVVPESSTAQQETQQEFSPLHRQSGDQLPYKPQKLPLLPSESEKKPYQANPSVTIINPSAYGASWGNAGIGIGFQERTRFSNQSDGVVGVGIGLGNPRQNVGLEVGIITVDLLGDTLEDGAINLKLHRQLPKDFAVAVGVQGAVTWGNTDGGSSVYGVVSKRFALKQDQSKPFSEIHLSAGIGGGQFRSESDVDDGVDSVGGFGSVAVRIVEPVSAIAEWTGQDLTVGLSVVPFRRIPLVIAPAITDITGTAGDGGRFILGVGYGFSW
ncbi:MAG: hypothetical protein F6K58_15700 [Symploca sp. SIO2E9]|nr:hypothetical protein [Symploca sp. SIO2E9]